jgi:type IV pilus assembly protein PilA
MAREVHLAVDSGVATDDMERGSASRWGERRRRAGVEGGFTMIEVMLVVGVLAILAMLATYGVRRHLALAKSAEAVHTVGVISRAAVAASERMATDGNAAGVIAVTGGGKKGKGANVTHGGLPVCGDSTAVPSSFAAVQKKKYQPNSQAGKDYDAGTMGTGWRCLRFEISSPQYYQYQYKLGGPPITVQLPHGGSPKGLSGGQEWSAYARGDLDGNGKIAWFIREGYERNGQMVTSSGIAMQDPEE